jgi:hypothetical protein
MFYRIRNIREWKHLGLVHLDLRIVRARDLLDSLILCHPVVMLTEGTQLVL